MQMPEGKWSADWSVVLITVVMSQPVILLEPGQLQGLSLQAFLDGLC